METVKSILLDVLFNIPGACLRWFFFRKRKNFKELQRELKHNIVATIIWLLLVTIFLVVTGHCCWNVYL